MSDAYLSTITRSAALFCLLACSTSEQPPGSTGAAGQARAPDSVVLAAGSGATLDAFEEAEFAEPSLEFAPGIRWIWPGDGVDDATLRAEVERFAAAGYGMIEI